jgi:CTP synthase
LNESAREKIALYCNISQSDVISGHDTSNVYNYPFQLLEEGILTSIFNRLHIGPRRVPALEQWKKLVEGLENPSEELIIGIGGKYTRLEDAYVSIDKALTHCGAHLKLKIKLRFIETTDLDEEELDKHLDDVSGVIIPGGFGIRGIEGKITLVQKIREKNIPFLGICLGLQCAVIEYARNVCGLKEANSTEFEPNTPHPVLDLLPSQKKIYRKGGTMRLGAYPVKIKENTLAHSVYQDLSIHERFRHRYEVNPDYKNKLEECGFIFSGTSDEDSIVHIGELKDHPFFMGTQYHPEFLSRFESPSKIFMALVDACHKYKKEKRKI